MNLKNIFLLGILAPSFIHPQLSNVESRQTASCCSQPLAKLWKGIATSDPKLVRQALDAGVDTSLRGGPYGDTPLMAALRKIATEELI